METYQVYGVKYFQKQGKYFTNSYLHKYNCKCPNCHVKLDKYGRGKFKDHKLNLKTL